MVLLISLQYSSMFDLQFSISISPLPLPFLPLPLLLLLPFPNLDESAQKPANPPAANAIYPFHLRRGQRPVEQVHILLQMRP